MTMYDAALGEIVTVPIGAGRSHGRDAVLARVAARRRASLMSGEASSDQVWGLAVIGSDGEVRAMSVTIAAALGHDARGLLGRNIFDVIHPDDHSRALASLAPAATVPGEKYPLDLRFLRPDGSSTLLEVIAEDLAGDTVDEVVISGSVISGRTEDDALIGEQLRVLDMIGRGEWVATTLAEIARLAAARLGAACAVFVLDDARSGLRIAASDGLGEESIRRLDRTSVRADTNTVGRSVHLGAALSCRDVSGDPAWGEAATSLLADGLVTCWADPMTTYGDDAAIGALGFFGPVGWTATAQHVRAADLFTRMATVAVQRGETEAHLAYQATHDPLTALPNRALFLDRLDRALERRTPGGDPVAVMFLDLDRFKVVNDALGHEAGDELLVAVADRIRAVSDAGTCVARFGGDEFTVLVDAVPSSTDAIAVAERIVASLRAPIPVGDTEVVMTVSIGLALSRQRHVEASTMLRDADAAMYRAKHRGRNRVEVFDDQMRAIAMARLDLEHALRESMARGDFALNYQPQICLERIEVVGAEALLRWSHPDRGAVAPADFIPVAEETGAIVELGDWVLAEACRQALRWGLVAPSAPRMWVNMSVVQLLHPGFPERVRAMIEAVGLDPTRIGLEITESSLMTDIDAAISTLGALKDLGVATAIDDFGTGYASLAYLRRLPVDFVKLDQTFVRDLSVGTKGAAVVGAIVELVHATGSSLVAEGVETEDEFVALRELGCDGAQGHWIGRPIEPAEVLASFTWAG